MTLFYHIGFLLLFTSVVGQSQNSIEIIIMSSKGEAYYSPEDGKENIPIIPGLRLPIKGSLFLNEEARVRILSQSRSKLLNGPGRYAMNDLISKKVIKSMSFTSRFWNFVIEGMGSKEDKKDLVKYHRDYMEIHGGVKGYISTSEFCTLLNPIGGKIASDDMIFTWDCLDSMSLITFRMMDESRKVLYEHQTQDQSLEISMSDIGGNVGETYIWLIDNGVNQTESSIEYKPHKNAEILEKLLYVEDYMGASDSEKSWMKAVVLEMENYPYEADKIYQEVLLSDGDNYFIKDHYAMFLSRLGRIKEAKSVLNNK